MDEKNAIVPIADVERMALAIAKSGLFGVKTPDQALALMLVAQAEGLHPAIAARDYHIIQGRPAKTADAMLRGFLQSGGTVKWHKSDDTAADATFSHPAGGELRITWSMETAKKAGLAGKDMWNKYPRQMLRARCISEGVRAVCPMATSGMYVPEEVEDIVAEQKAKDVTPPKVTMEHPAPVENIVEKALVGTKVVTANQIKRLWTIAHDSNWTDEDVHKNLKRTLKIESVKELMAGDYDKFCTYMQNNPKEDQPEEDLFEEEDNYEPELHT